MNVKSMLLSFIVLLSLSITETIAQRNTERRSRQYSEQRDDRSQARCQKQRKGSKVKKFHQRKMIQMAKADGRISREERRLLKQGRVKRNHRHRQVF